MATTGRVSSLTQVVAAAIVILGMAACAPSSGTPSGNPGAQAPRLTRTLVGMVGTEPTSLAGVPLLTGGVPFDVEKCTTQSPDSLRSQLNSLGRVVSLNCYSRQFSVPDAAGTRAARADLRPIRR